MNTTIIIAFAGVMAASVVLAIPFMIMNGKAKKKEAAFHEDNRNKAILHLYSDHSKIDGCDIKNLEHLSRGQYGQQIVSLTPGTHTFEGRFQTTSAELGGNKNYKSEILKFDLNLEAGHTYTLAVYFYSPEQRDSYYKGDVGKDVFTLELNVEGGSIGGYQQAYVICYEEE